MKYKSFIDFNYDYLRFDTSWKFEWNVNDITSSTIKFYPLTEVGTNKGWTLCGDASVTEHDPQVWNASQPWVEYSADAVEQWNAEHPNNPTKYLSGWGHLLKLTNTVETVIIDNIPPEFVSDKGTDYIYIKSDDADVVRHCEFVFRDQCGLDYKQFKVSVGNTILYEYNRKTPEDTVINRIIPESLKIYSDGQHTYKVAFDMTYGNTQAETDVLNETGLTLTVYDKAANVSTYTLGVGEWKFIPSENDITNLKKVVIKFYDAEPKNKIVTEDTFGSVWCSVYNPNREFWSIPVKANLLDTSVGIIDMMTYTYDETTGMLKFKVINIVEKGSVSVGGWLESGMATYDSILKNSTYAEGSFGPFIIQDADGRKYDFKRFTPAYLKNTDIGSFIDFIQLYMNTLYTNITKGTNISALEKIAKINDLTEIDQIEDFLVENYAETFGSEFDIDLSSLQKMNAEIGQNKDNYDIIKYALKNLPYYNQLKGTEKGMMFALNMFSLACKIINLWCKTGVDVDTNPVYIEEDVLKSFTGYFQTNRFNLEYYSSGASFKVFNENIGTLIRLINSIKPITHMLNMIKYTIVFKHDYIWLYNEYSHDDNGGTFTYSIEWSDVYVDEIIYRSKIDTKTKQANRVWFNYNADKIDVDVSDATATTPLSMTNGYTLLSALMESVNSKFTFSFSNTSSSHTKTIKVADIDVLPYESGLYIVPQTAAVAADLYDFIARLSAMDGAKVTMSITHIPGTEVFN